MSVYKPKGSPYYWYDFQVKGRRFYDSTGTQSERKARDIEAAAREKAVRGNYYPNEEKMTLDVAAGYYWEDVAKAQSSAETTEYQLANLIKLIGKDVYLSEISSKVVAGFMRRRRGETSRNGGFISPSSVNREVQLLRRVMYRARDVYEIAIPRVDWKTFKLQEPDPVERPLGEDEEPRLLAELVAHLKDPFRFSLMTGFRAENTFALDWTQVDFQAREITVRMKSKKPGGKVHILPITDEMLVLLAQQGPKDKGPVFTYKGQLIRSYRTAWKAACRRAGVEGLRWHDLRHTVGTRLVQRDHDISEVQDYLGHADIATTRRYVHHKASAKHKMMETLSQNSPKVENAASPTALKRNA